MKKMLFPMVLILAISLIIVPMAHADVIDPFDNIDAPPGAFATGFYFNYQHLPEYSPKHGSDIGIHVDVSALAIRPVYFFPKKLFGKLSWGGKCDYSICPCEHG